MFNQHTSKHIVYNGNWLFSVNNIVQTLQSYLLLCHTKWRFRLRTRKKHLAPIKLQLS